MLVFYSNTLIFSIFCSMETTQLTEKGRQLLRQAGAMREDLTVSYEVNASVHRSRQKMQEEFSVH